jgi:hypothetical protein
VPVHFCTISNGPERWQTILSLNALLPIPSSQYKRVDDATMFLAQLRQSCNDGTCITGFASIAQNIKIPSNGDESREDSLRYGASRYPCNRPDTRIADAGYECCDHHRRGAGLGPTGRGPTCVWGMARKLAARWAPTRRAPVSRREGRR